MERGCQQNDSLADGYSRPARRRRRKASPTWPGWRAACGRPARSPRGVWQGRGPKTGRPRTAAPSELPVKRPVLLEGGNTRKGSANDANLRTSRVHLEQCRRDGTRLLLVGDRLLLRTTARQGRCLSQDGSGDPLAKALQLGRQLKDKARALSYWPSQVLRARLELQLEVHQARQ